MVIAGLFLAAVMTWLAGRSVATDMAPVVRGAEYRAVEGAPADYPLRLWLDGRETLLGLGGSFVGDWGGQVPHDWSETRRLDDGMRWPHEPMRHRTQVVDAAGEPHLFRQEHWLVGTTCDAAEATCRFALIAASGITEGCIRMPAFATPKGGREPVAVPCSLVERVRPKLARFAADALALGLGAIAVATVVLAVGATLRSIRPLFGGQRWQRGAVPALWTGAAVMTSAQVAAIQFWLHLAGLMDVERLLVIGLGIPLGLLALHATRRAVC